jgi:hypothetical protein
MEVNGGRLYSYKRLSKRGLPANRGDNKLIRKNVANLVLNLEDDGFLPVYVDEAHWQMEPNRPYGWSGKAEKLLVGMGNNPLTISTMCAISLFGMEYTEVVLGSSVNADVFTAYAMRLMLSLKEKNRARCLFYYDNSPVHSNVYFPFSSVNLCRHY